MWRRNWLTIALVVSVALNVALAGFVLGRLSGRPAAPAVLEPAIGLFRVVRELPEPRREELRPVLRQHMRSLRPEIRAIREAQERINAALGQQPFAGNDLAAALEEFRAALLASQIRSHGLLVQIAAAMTPEERLLLRRTLTRPPHRHRSRADDDSGE